MQKPENRRILVVDDEPEIRAGYRHFLSPERMEKIISSRHKPASDAPRNGEFALEVVEASSGDQAFEILQSDLNAGRKFAGAIVDVRMPGRLDGLQFIQKAWELDPDLLVVVATAYQDRSVDEITRMFGQQFQDQWDYLNKPFTSGEIVQKARQLVSSWNRRAREREYIEMIKSQSAALIAQEQAAAVGKLAATVGHDLGNILQQVLTKLELGSPHEEIIEAVELGANICRDLLTFSKRTQGSTNNAEQLTAVEMSVPLSKSLRLLRQQTQRKDIQVKLEVAEGIKWVCLEERVVQVFVNLMTNAIFAMSSGGALTVLGRRDGSKGVVEIKDTGGGISPEDLAKVFEPLFTTKGDKGNGLGLTVCRSIVERYSGTIVLESELGKGTTAKITFPLAN